MAFIKRLSGSKTYFAAIGLFGLALFQFSTGEIPQGFQSLFSALVAAGLRAAIAAPKA